MSNAEARQAKAKSTVRAETTLHAAPTQLRPKIVIYNKARRSNAKAELKQSQSSAKATLEQRESNAKATLSECECSSTATL